MIRPYNVTDKLEAVEYFVGNEVENILTVGSKTLFVATNKFKVNFVLESAKVNMCHSIYIGANHCLSHSLDTDLNLIRRINKLIKKSKNIYNVVIDISHENLHLLNEINTNKNHVIVVISVKVPEIDRYKNAMEYKRELLLSKIEQRDELSREIMTLQRQVLEMQIKLKNKVE